MEDRGGDPLVIEEWKVDGKLHREDGPAFVSTEPSGDLRCAIYCRDGQHHRVDGPALVDPEMGDEWWLHGAPVVGPKIAAKILGDFGAKRLRAELVRSSYRELLDEGTSPSLILGALSHGVTTVEGMREIAAGAPAEWVRSFEEGRS